MKAFARFLAGGALAALAASTIAQSAPAWVPTTALTPAEMRVSQAYQAVFGRIPDKDGLAYWSAQPMAGSIATAVDTLSGYAPGIANYDFARQAYSFLLGRSLADDQSGIRYWACQMPWDNSQVEAEGYATFCSSFGTKTKGQMIQDLIGLLDPSSDPVYQKRKAFLDYAGRVQKVAPGAYAGITRKGLTGSNMLEMQALLRRVSSHITAFDEAMNDLNRLTNTAGAANPVNAFDIAWTPTALWDQANDFSGSGVKVNRHVVWYNRAGQMMVSQAYLPGTFPSASGLQAVVSLHSGGWKEGMPDNIGKLNHEFVAQGGYVVLSPGYRLTPGYASPAQENDVEDFVALVKANPGMFKINAAKVHLFGYSAGGHLAALLGAKGNYGCVATFAAPLDLTASADFSAQLLADINAYAGSTPKANLSPRWQLGLGTTTKFMAMYGNVDGIVGPNQATSFAAAAPTRVQTQAFNGGHLIPDVAVYWVVYHARARYAAC